MNKRVCDNCGKSPAPYVVHEDDWGDLNACAKCAGYEEEAPGAVEVDPRVLRAPSKRYKAWR